MQLGVSIKAYCNPLQGLFYGKKVIRPLSRYSFRSSQSILINDRLWYLAMTAALASRRLIRYRLFTCWKFRFVFDLQPHDLLTSCT